jgi:colanic acid/amylovoran biosynthesis glycosyltransferase
MSHRIAYLISQYPAYSHTFILREVLQLRELGMAISVASINDPDRAIDKLTAVEHAEAEACFYVKRQGLINALRALGLSLRSHPGGVMRGLWQSIKLGDWDLRRSIYHLFYLLEALLIGQWMRQHDLSHLHVHFATPAASVGMLCKTVFGIGFSFTVHGPDEFYDAPGYRLPEKIVAADFILCISHYARSQVMKLSAVNAWSKFDICRLGVDPERFKPQPKTGDDQRKHLLCVGRLTPAKGQAILLEAMAQLLKNALPLKLTLVGMGPDHDSLQCHAQTLGIQQYVNFAGAVDQEHILEVYRDADIFVLPSFAEGLPVVLMEAMAMGIPCVTTAITGIPELIQHRQNGLLVPASDVEGLAAAIQELLENPQFCHQMREAARNKVLEDYDLSRNAQHLFNTMTRRLDALYPTSSR